VFSDSKIWHVRRETRNRCFGHHVQCESIKLCCKEIVDGIIIGTVRFKTVTLQAACIYVSHGILMIMKRLSYAKLLLMQAHCALCEVRN
jgi:hypothetical protein